MVTPLMAVCFIVPFVLSFFFAWLLYNKLLRSDGAGAITWSILLFLVSFAVTFFITFLIFSKVTGFHG
jgi:hypothetical protein